MNRRANDESETILAFLAGALFASVAWMALLELMR